MSHIRKWQVKGLILKEPGGKGTSLTLIQRQALIKFGLNFCSEEQIILASTIQLFEIFVISIAISSSHFYFT